MVEIELRVLCILSKHSNSEWHPSPMRPLTDNIKWIPYGWSHDKQNDMELNTMQLRDATTWDVSMSVCYGHNMNYYFTIKFFISGKSIHVNNKKNNIVNA